MLLVTSCGGSFCLRQKLRMDPHDERLLVIAAVEDADMAAVGQALHAAPEIVVIQLFGGRGLEGEDLAPLGVDPGHDVLDGAVLAGGVHRLEDQQHRPLVLGVEFVLQLGQRLDARGQRFLGARLVFALEPKRLARVKSFRRNSLPLVTRKGSVTLRHRRTISFILIFITSFP